MAIYSFSHQVIGRSSGRSAVGASAYRSGERLWDERRGQEHDYTRRRDRIESWIEGPEGAPNWSREQLWNEAEGRETRVNSRTAHEWRVALPVELSEDRQRELVRGWVREEIVSRGVVADVAIHRGDPGNPHAHIMATTREVGSEGLGRKVREWNDIRQYDRWRKGWEHAANRELDRAGVRERIDHRSHRDRGLDREPTVHEGPYVRELEARGYRTYTAVCAQDLSQIIGKLTKADAMSSASNARIKLFGQSEDPETMSYAEQVSGKVRVPKEPDAPAAERWKNTVRRPRLLDEHLQDLDYGTFFARSQTVRRLREVVTMPHPDTYGTSLLRRLGAKPWTYRPRGVPRKQQEKVLKRLVVGELRPSKWGYG